MKEEDKSALRSSVQGYLVSRALYYGCIRAYYFALLSGGGVVF